MRRNARAANTRSLGECEANAWRSSRAARPCPRAPRIARWRSPPAPENRCTCAPRRRVRRARRESRSGRRRGQELQRFALVGIGAQHAVELREALLDQPRAPHPVRQRDALRRFVAADAAPSLLAWASSSRSPACHGARRERRPLARAGIQWSSTQRERPRTLPPSTRYRTRLRSRARSSWALAASDVGCCACGCWLVELQSEQRARTAQAQREDQLRGRHSDCLSATG